MDNYQIEISSQVRLLSITQEIKVRILIGYLHYSGMDCIRQSDARRYSVLGIVCSFRYTLANWTQELKTNLHCVFLAR